MRVPGEIRRRSRQLVALYLLISILLGYVSLDLVGKWYCDENRLVSAWSSAAGVNGKTDVCSMMEGHYDTSLSSWDRSGGDPWQQLKWVGEPAYCKVKGHLIEKIDDDNNFRRGFALRHTPDVEDRLHILPWLLGSRVNLNARARRLYLDLGANSFATSVGWFMQLYPCDFTEIHAFEKESSLFNMPQQGFDEEANWAAQPNPNSLRVNRKAEFPQWMLDRVKFYNKFVADEDDDARGYVNITRFIKEELQLTPDDTVVIKMDIESAEWAILNRWMEDPQMVSIVDEVFVEIHYDHSTMAAYGWSQFQPKSREDAKRLLAELRWRGFFAHFWP